MRNLTAGRMMRRDVKTIPAATSLAEFRRRYPDAVLPPELRKLEH